MIQNRFTQAIAAPIAIFLSVIVLSLSFAPSAAAACDSRFLGMPPWYMGLTEGSDCSIKMGNSDGSMADFIWRIVMNIGEAIMILTAYASVVMIIYGGFTYMVATGQSDKISSAKKTILNAIIGLLIALSSVAIINVVRGVI